VTLIEKQANPGTPGAAFGSREKLPWIEEILPVKPDSNAIIWDALYSTIREGAVFPISMEQALAVMRVISIAKQGTEF
jgi:hypothetical protein